MQENSLWLKIYRSPPDLPHARIRAIHTSDAKELPGVAGVFTHEDIPGKNVSYALLPDRHLLAYDKIRCSLEPIAIVVAKDQHVAEEACEKIRVEYEPLPTVFDVDEALKPDAPKVHENGNIASRHKIKKGNVEEGKKLSDYIFENTYETSRQEPLPLETEQCFALPEKDSITLIGSFQNLNWIQSFASSILNLPIENVRVIQPATGGTFGTKSDAYDWALFVGLAALILQRPVSFIASREESILTHTYRHPSKIHRKVGVSKYGKLQFMEADLKLDTGAYESLGRGVLIRANNHVTGPYYIPHIESEAVLVYTNNPISGSFRGFGCPQAHFAAESQMDEIADRLGLDPIEFRLKNILRPGLTTANGQVLEESFSLEECVLKVRDTSRWNEKRREYSVKNEAQAIRYGIGISLIHHGNSFGPTGRKEPDSSECVIFISLAGEIIYRSTASEYGTGAKLTNAKLAAKYIGIPPQFVNVEISDTRDNVVTGPTVASRQLPIGGNAAIDAGKKCRQKIKELAASYLACDDSEIELSGEINGVEVYRKSNPSQRLTLKELVNGCTKKEIITNSEEDLKIIGRYVAPKLEYDPETAQGYCYQGYTSGAVISEVKVDTILGYIDATEIHVSYDVGKVIDPIALEGQVEGGTAQALGYALMEDLVSVDGRIRNPNLCDYYVPTAMDTPRIKIDFVEHKSLIGADGAKAMGEIPVDGPAAAVVNAIFHATGVRIRKIPVSPERILNEMRKL